MRVYKHGGAVMKRFKTIIIVMIVVAVLATWILQKDHSAVELQWRILIAAGGALLSGVLAYFLLQKDIEHVDPKSDQN